MPNPLEQSFQYCRSLTQRKAGNFYFSFLTLPRAKRDAMCAIYAWMRRLDDLADDASSPQHARGSLEQWRTHTQAALKTPPPITHPQPPLLWPAFIDTVNRYRIPPRYFEEIVEGALMDQEITRYTTFEELYHYCYRVASVVGLVCLRIFEYTNPQAEQKGEWLGIAFQLTNILRDVGEDAGRGRIYIPRENMRRYGVLEKDILNGRWSESLHELLKSFAEQAEEYYLRAHSLESLVSREARPTLRIMTEIYHGILMEIQKMNFHVFGQRAHLPLWKKMWIVAKHRLFSHSPCDTQSEG